MVQSSGSGRDVDYEVQPSNPGLVAPSDGGSVVVAILRFLGLL